MSRTHLLKNWASVWRESSGSGAEWALVEHQLPHGSWRYIHWYGKRCETKCVRTMRTGSVACGNIPRCHAVLSVTGTETSRATALSEDCVVGSGTANTQKGNAPHEPRCAYPVQEGESDVPTSPPVVSPTGQVAYSKTSKNQSVADSST